MPNKLLVECALTSLEALINSLEVPINICIYIRIKIDNYGININVRVYMVYSVNR